MHTIMYCRQYIRDYASPSDQNRFPLIVHLLPTSISVIIINTFTILITCFIIIYTTPHSSTTVTSIKLIAEAVSHDTYLPVLSTNFHYHHYKMPIYLQSKIKISRASVVRFFFFLMALGLCACHSTINFELFTWEICSFISE